MGLYGVMYGIIWSNDGQYGIIWSNVWDYME